MLNLRSAIRAAIKQERRDFISAEARKQRFAYTEGVNTLYKFKSLAGESRDHVRDIIENSRLYFSTQDELNDPDDCRPIFKLGGNPADPAFMAELKADEDEMIRGMKITPEAEVDLRATQGTRIEDMAAAITRNVRAELLRTLHIFCFSATKDNSQLWSYYANSHKGVCLHFEVAAGALTGLARGVDYEASVPPVLVPLRYNPGDQEAARRMSLIKLKGWSHEAEYRILANPDVDWGHPINGRYVSFSPENLTAITLGLKISPQGRAEVLTWGRQENAAAAGLGSLRRPSNVQSWIPTHSLEGVNGVEFIVIENPYKRYHSVHGTRLVHEYYGSIMAFAYSRWPLGQLVDNQFLGGWKYLHKALFEIPEETATRALIELGLYIRIIDDDEGKVSSFLRRKDAYGEVERLDGSREPLSYREVTNKIIHAANYRWNFPEGQQPSVTCIAAKDEGAKHKWVSATIDLVGLGAICGAFMS